jgi:hypothetical protein
MSNLCLAIGIAANLIAPKPVEVQFAQSMAGRNVTVQIDGRVTKTTYAGKLAFRDSNRTWQALCAEVRKPIRAGQFFFVRPWNTAKVGGRVAMAGNIVAKYFHAAKTDDQCAGLQLAVWEAMEDGGAHADFRNGRFRAMASPAVLDYGTDFYEAIYEAREAAYLQDGGDGQSQISTT